VIEDDVIIDKPTVERCFEEIASGLNVHRWLDLWRGHPDLNEAVAIAFYHQALQDAGDAILALTEPAGEGELR
jgi:hypothetical protein